MSMQGEPAIAGGGNFFTKKIGFLPVWGWAAVGVGAYFAYKKFGGSISGLFSGSSSGTSTDTTGDTTGDTTSDTTTSDDMVAEALSGMQADLSQITATVTNPDGIITRPGASVVTKKVYKDAHGVITSGNSTTKAWTGYLKTHPKMVDNQKNYNAWYKNNHK